MTNSAPAITTEMSSSARLPARDVADLSCSAVADDEDDDDDEGAALIAADRALLPMPLRTLAFLLLAASRTGASLPLLPWASVSCRLSTPAAPPSVVCDGFCILVTVEGGGGGEGAGDVTLALIRGGLAGLLSLGPSGCTSAAHTLAHHTHSATERQALALPRAILTSECPAVAGEGTVLGLARRLRRGRN